ncbi:hypothetical protein [Paenibacillus popilliae]|uniref:Periplasmic component n=1 Tax=Paenibacillus popilliae ATCC 14706 TaxID=1212764 RepID=M9M8J8_PAEPP|nr:hypothetical protein [Paenibacillus popilliae]GAC44298.1 periplasmic component [Paenibacillus popilliae ATCC 14706]
MRRFKKMIILASIVTSMTVMSQSAFADNVHRCHAFTKQCIPDKNNTGTGSTKYEYYERRTGNFVGYEKERRG